MYWVRGDTYNHESLFAFRKRLIVRSVTFTFSGLIDRAENINGEF